MQVFQKTEPNIKGSVTVVAGLTPKQTSWLKDAIQGTEACLKQAIVDGDNVETEQIDFLSQLSEGLKTTDEVISERSSEPDPDDSEYAAPV